MNYKLILLALLSVLLGCEKGDGYMDFGYNYIYIPQAMSSGGTNINYFVPSGGGENTYNFKVEDGKVNIILGVLRSGSFSSKPYSVSVKAVETSGEILSSLNGTSLPASIYTLPNTVNVSSNLTGQTFYLSIDSEALKNPLYDDQTLVLTVEIFNPSFFELAEKGSTVNVVLNVDRIRSFLQ